MPDYGNPQSLNRYTYVYDNPARYYDSDGHCLPVCTPALLWLAFDYLPRETLAAGAREVAGWGVPVVSDLAALDAYAVDQLWLAVNGDELGLTTKQHIDTAGEGYIALANEAFTIYGVAGGVKAAKDTLSQVRNNSSTPKSAPPPQLSEPAPNAYSVAYEMELSPADYGKSRSVHFNRANAALDAALQSDPQFATQMEAQIPGVTQSVSRAGGRIQPPGWTWHHAPDRPGVMQLVPSYQHTPGSAWWDLLHPGGQGGYSIWAIPSGAPSN